MGWVIGTAGHIDHGKSALVRALTGVDPDRLPEERARGITIDLGFAPLILPGGGRASIVDVPGHERFVETMVAGASGIDLVMLVIAADGGVMPQTREHLAICTLLGVPHAVVVLSRADLVDAPTLASRTTEARALLAGTGLAAAPIVATSAVTGAGLDQLRAALAAALAARVRAATDEPTRLPIDRVFTVRGAGTVVTGTLRGQPLRVGDELVAMPGGAPLRVRGLHVHDQPVAEVPAPARVAVNVAGDGVAGLARGHVLARAGELAMSALIDVELERLPPTPGTRAEPWPRRRQVVVAHGTTHVPAELVLLGDGALAQLRPRGGLAVVPGDRFVLLGALRSPHRGRTIGGGRVVRPFAVRARGAAGLATATMFARGGARLDHELALAASAGRTTAELVLRLGLPTAAATAQVEAALASGAARRLGDRVLARGAADALEARVLAHLPAPLASLRGALPAAVPARVAEAIVDGLRARGALVVEVATGLTRAAGAAPTVDPLEVALRARFAAWGLAPPRPADVAAAVDAPAAAVRTTMTRLLAARALVKVNPDLVVDAAAYDALKAALLALLAARGEVTTDAWKQLTGVSRKHSIPLAEHFDAAHVTRRVGDVRKAWGAR